MSTNKTQGSMMTKTKEKTQISKTSKTKKIISCMMIFGVLINNTDLYAKWILAKQCTISEKGLSRRRFLMNALSSTSDCCTEYGKVVEYKYCDPNNPTKNKTKNIIFATLNDVARMLLEKLCATQNMPGLSQSIPEYKTYLSERESYCQNPTEQNLWKIVDMVMENHKTQIKTEGAEGTTQTQQADKHNKKKKSSCNEKPAATDEEEQRLYGQSGEYGKSRDEKLQDDNSESSSGYQESGEETTKKQQLIDDSSKLRNLLNNKNTGGREYGKSRDEKLQDDNSESSSGYQESGEETTKKQQLIDDSSKLRNLLNNKNTGGREYGKSRDEKLQDDNSESSSGYQESGEETTKKQQLIDDSSKLRNLLNNKNTGDRQDTIQKIQELFNKIKDASKQFLIEEQVLENIAGALLNIVNPDHKDITNRVTMTQGLIDIIKKHEYKLTRGAISDIACALCNLIYLQNIPYIPYKVKMTQELINIIKDKKHKDKTEDQMVFGNIARALNNLHYKNNTAIYEATRQGIHNDLISIIKYKKGLLNTDAYNDLCFAIESLAEQYITNSNIGTFIVDIIDLLKDKEVLTQSSNNDAFDILQRAINTLQNAPVDDKSDQQKRTSKIQNMINGIQAIINNRNSKQ